MAMVKIRRGQNFAKVSRSSYETLFRKKGYRIVGEEAVANTDEEEQFEEEHKEEEKKVETIPISEMNREQLAEYAKEHDIDTSSARNVREARQIIQKAVREAKM